MNFEKKQRTERVIQFGEGGFLRGFVDWMLQKVNENSDFDGSVVVVQPIEQGMCDMLTAQNCVYTHVIRGVEGVDTTVVDVISRCVKPYEDIPNGMSHRTNDLLLRLVFWVAISTQDPDYIIFPISLGNVATIFGSTLTIEKRVVVVPIVAPCRQKSNIKSHLGGSA